MSAQSDGAKSVFGARTYAAIVGKLGGLGAEVRTDGEKGLVGGQNGGIISGADHEGDDGRAEVIDELGASLGLGLLLGEGKLLVAGIVLFDNIIAHLNIGARFGRIVLSDFLGAVGHCELFLGWIAELQELGEGMWGFGVLGFCGETFVRKTELAVCNAGQESRLSEW